MEYVISRSYAILKSRLDIPNYKVARGEIHQHKCTLNSESSKVIYIAKSLAQTMLFLRLSCTPEKKI